MDSSNVLKRLTHAALLVAALVVIGDYLTRPAAADASVRKIVGFAAQEHRWFIVLENGDVYQSDRGDDGRGNVGYLKAKYSSNVWNGAPGQRK